MEKPVKKGDFVTKKEAGISVTHSHAVTHGHAITHGYARCSTNEDRQDIDRQTRELKKHGAEKVWLEYEHGDAASKEQQALMLETARPGDTIVTMEVSRLARSTKQLCEIIDIIREKRLRLVIVGSITLDCRNGNPDPMTEAFLQIAGVFSQLELSMIRSRVRSGVENARPRASGWAGLRSARKGCRNSSCDTIPAIRAAASTSRNWPGWHRSPGLRLTAISRR